MRMNSHYSPGRTRWVLAAVAFLYAMTAAFAPAAHLADEAQDHRLYLEALAAFDGSGPEPIPPAHGTDELDCLFCQALSVPLHTSTADVKAPAGPALSVTKPGSPGLVTRSSSSALGARAPPSL